MKLEKIGRYDIKAELGRGGMATVYHGYDPRFEREVAIKVLPPELLHADPNFRMRFEREAKIIAQLEHPSIVPVYDVGEENDRPYFVMRYMGGGSLSDRIKKSIFSVEDAARILEQIAPGLDEAHSKGIIHRDLKPGNILFNNRNVPSISDFGIAKMIQSETGNVTGSGIIGTPAYMAPEQAAGESIDGRADIYAMGILFYEMLTGRQPYEADTPMGIAIKHITEPVPHILDVNPTLPSWVEKIISTAMAKDRNDRFSTAVEMTETIRAYLKGEQPSLPENKLNEKTLKVAPFNKTVNAKKIKRERRFNPLIPLIAIVSLAFIVLIGGGIYFLSGSGIPFVGEAPSKTPTSLPPTQTSTSVIEATEAPSTATKTATETETATQTPIAATDTPAPPLPPVLGGADKIAFLRNNDIWVMNVDGSDLVQVTNDGSEKFNLEWMLDGSTILYISGKTIKTVNIETLKTESITSFSSSEYFESFHLSPDGKQAAISLARELHVVPFDLENFKKITNKRDLLALNGCIFFNSAEVKDALWSDDGLKLAIKFPILTGKKVADTIRIIDIQKCKDAAPLRLDEFPGTRFSFSDTITNFDWDGNQLFFLNSNIRNNGFGDLGLYNTSIYSFEKLAPIDNICCYRDATFSPDGTYVIFAFQNIRLGSESPIILYYIYADSLTTNETFQPLPLPSGFFTKRTDAPMPAFRPAKK